MISQQELINNFKVSGSYVTLNYEKYKTTELPTVKLFISNSSNTVSLQFFPTGSPDTKLSFTRTDGVAIDKNYPITLPPNTGSNINFIELFVNVDSTNFDQLSTSDSQQFNIKFNVVAVTSSLVTVNQPPQFGPLSLTPFIGGGSGGVIPSTTPSGFTPPLTNEF